MFVPRVLSDPAAVLTYICPSVVSILLRVLTDVRPSVLSIPRQC